MEASQINYSTALLALKGGRKIARQGWNGKGMFVFLVKGDCIAQAIKDCYGDSTSNETPKVNDFTLLYGADGSFSAWVPSSTDQLADDWQILD